MSIELWQMMPCGGRIPRRCLLTLVTICLVVVGYYTIWELVWREGVAWHGGTSEGVVAKLHRTWTSPSWSRSESLQAGCRCNSPSSHVDSSESGGRRRLPWVSDPELPRACTEQENWLMLTLLNSLVRVLNLHDISYVIYGGTLLGSVLFHDVIPWDEDLDVFVDSKHKRFLEKTLKLEPEFRIVPHSTFSKFFHTASKRYNTQAKHVTWNWPFVDIVYYSSNTTHIWEHHKNTDLSRTWFRDSVFPVQERPLGGYMFKAPRHSVNFVKVMLRKSNRQKFLTKPSVIPAHSTAPDFKCESDPWDHRNERSVKTMKTDCQNLRDSYPAVHSEHFQGMIVERLMLGNKVLRTCFCEEPENAEHAVMSLSKSKPEKPLQVLNTQEIRLYE